MLWAIILVCVVALFNLFQSASPRNASREIYFSDFMAAVDLYINETTRHAHIILPPATALAAARQARTRAPSSARVALASFSLMTGMVGSII